MKPFFVGCAKRVITPEPGCELAGFAARKGVANGVHDDLFAGALVISCETRTVVLVSLDVIAISQELADSVRRAVGESLRISPMDVMLCSTHTHCGPVTINHFFNPDQSLNLAYLAMFERKILAAIQEAWQQRKPSLIRAGMVPVQGIAVNRRSESGQPIDPEAGVLLVEDLDGVPTSILINYACHPTVLGPDTLEVTGDFPHYLNRTICRELGEDVLVLFFNGAEGDLNIGHKSWSTAVGAKSRSRTFEKAQEVGEALGRQVLLGLPSLVAEEPVLCRDSSTVPLPLKHYEPLSWMQQVRERAAAEAQLAEQMHAPGSEPSAELLEKRCALLYASIDEYFAAEHERQGITRLPAEVSVIRIGGTSIVTFPGEVFVATGLAIRKRSPFRCTLLLGLVNGYIGYVPTLEEAENGGYEVVASQVQATASALIEGTAHGLLETAFSRPCENHVAQTGASQ